VIALVVLGVLVSSSVLLHPRRGIVGANPVDDFQIMTWSLEWWPWSIWHGVDPLRTHLLWAPGGFATAWVTSIPAVALTALPVTLLGGPLLAYNVMMFASVALASGCAFLLCREVTGRTWPSVVGGLIFGLSPYMIGHTLSQHLNLAFIWPVPLVAWMIVRRCRGTWTSRRSFVLVAAALFAVQLLSSLEIFLDLTLVLGIAFVIALLLRSDVLRVAGDVVLGYCACLPLLGAVAYITLTSPHGALAHPAADYSIDLVNVVVPTPLSLIGKGHAVRTLTRHFVGNIGEQDGYLGIPLIAVVALAARARWRQGAGVAVCLLVVLVALSLGPYLTVTGRPVAAIPFSTARFPLLSDTLPARLSLFSMLVAACLVAVWLSLATPAWLRIGVAVLIFASLLPNVVLSGRIPGAWARSSLARFSTSSAPAGFVDAPGWGRFLRSGENVLVLPTEDRTAAMYWQVKSGMRFALAVPGTPFVPAHLEAEPTVVGLTNGTLLPVDGVQLGAARLRAFLAFDRVGAVVVTESAGSRWRELVAQATHRSPVLLAGSFLYPVGVSAPLRASGERVTAGPLSAWIRYDGQRGHVEAKLGGAAPVTLSAPDGDAEETAAAADGGRAVVAFTEWHRGRLLLRIATHVRGGRWGVVTLDRRSQPMWSLRALVEPGGTTVVTWLDEDDPLRLVRAAVMTPQGSWTPVRTLDRAEGLAFADVAAGIRGTAVLAWQDSIGNEQRVRVATYSPAGWSSTKTVGDAVPNIDDLRITGRVAPSVEWRANGRLHVWHPQETR
jgi:hypothetical protein